VNTRQWELYNLLKKRALEDITKWVSKQEIVNALPDWYEIKEGETRTCRDIEFDVKDINMDDTIQKTIVSSQKGYKIGTPEEVHDFIYSKIFDGKERLRYAYKLRHKAELNHQYRIKFGQHERDIIESYIDK